MASNNLDDSSQNLNELYESMDLNLVRSTRFKQGAGNYI